MDLFTRWGESAAIKAMLVNDLYRMACEVGELTADTTLGDVAKLHPIQRHALALAMLGTGDAFQMVRAAFVMLDNFASAEETRRYASGIAVKP